jgi:hypothetical protein
VGLAEVEAALARLYTDDRLRENFFADPRAVGAELGLSDGEARQLGSADRRRVELFAESLRLKRLGEVRGLLPRTAAVLGDGELRALFLEFAGDFVPEGTHKHRADALAFAEYAAGRLCGQAREAARFDLAVQRLFFRLDGAAALPRSGPALAVARRDGRRVLLVRPWKSARYRSIQF